MDGPNNPTLSARRVAALLRPDKNTHMGRFLWGSGESGLDENPYGSTNLSGTNLDSRRLALERLARKGEALDGPNNPVLSARRKGALALNG